MLQQIQGSMHYQTLQVYNYADNFTNFESCIKGGGWYRTTSSLHASPNMGIQYLWRSSSDIVKSYLVEKTMYKAERRKKEEWHYYSVHVMTLRQPNARHWDSLARHWDSLVRHCESRETALWDIETALWANETMRQTQRHQDNKSLPDQREFTFFSSSSSRRIRHQYL